MRKFINYKKQNKDIIAKDVDVKEKNGIIFIGENKITEKTRHIFLSGRCNIDSKALYLLNEMRCTVILTHNNIPKTTLRPTTYNSRLKSRQVKMHISKRSINKIIKERDHTAVEVNLPKISKFIKNKNMFLLYEAQYMKHIYKICSSRAGVKWEGKSTTGQKTAIHSWWRTLYAAIETCMVKMGVDTDVGIIHTSNRAFVFDVADIFKPLFLEHALVNQPGDIKEFWLIYKKYNLKSRIPQTILSLLGDK